MSKLTLAALVVTVAFVVPVGWHVPEADIQSDGPKFRPEQKTLRVGDATVTVDFDRGLMMAGKTVSAILVASADQTHDVTVDLTATEDMGYGEQRVANPPRQIGTRTVKLHAQPGGGPPVVASFKLGSKGSTGLVEWFDLVVMPTTKKLRDQDDSIAKAGVATWGGNLFAVSIEPPAQIPAEGPFTIAVRVKNTTKAPFHYLDVEVGHEMASEGLDGFRISDRSDDFCLVRVDDTEISEAHPLAVGAEALLIYTVTAARPGIKHFSIAAYARSDANGAMDAATFDRPESPEPDHGTVAAR